MSTMIKKYDDLKIGTRILFFKDMYPYTGMVIEKTSNIIKLMYVCGSDYLPGMMPHGMYYAYGMTMKPLEIDANDDWYSTGKYELPKAVSVTERRYIQSIMHSCAEPTDISKISINRFFGIFPQRHMAITSRRTTIDDGENSLPLSTIILKTNIRFDYDLEHITRFVTIRSNTSVSRVNLYVVKLVWLDSCGKFFVYLKDLSNPYTYLSFMWLNSDYAVPSDKSEIIDAICEDENISSASINDITLDEKRDERDIDAVWELNWITAEKYDLHTDDYREIYDAKKGAFVDQSYLTRVL